MQSNTWAGLHCNWHIL